MRSLVLFNALLGGIIVAEGAFFLSFPLISPRVLQGDSTDISMGTIDEENGVDQLDDLSEKKAALNLQQHEKTGEKKIGETEEPTKYPSLPIEDHLTALPSLDKVLKASNGRDLRVWSMVTKNSGVGTVTQVLRQSQGRLETNKEPLQQTNENKTNLSFRELCLTEKKARRELLSQRIDFGASPTTSGRVSLLGRPVKIDLFSPLSLIKQQIEDIAEWSTLQGPNNSCALCSNGNVFASHNQTNVLSHNHSQSTTINSKIQKLIDIVMDAPFTRAPINLEESSEDDGTDDGVPDYDPDIIGATNPPGEQPFRRSFASNEEERPLLEEGNLNPAEQEHRRFLAAASRERIIHERIMHRESDLEEQRREDIAAYLALKLVAIRLLGKITPAYDPFIDTQYRETFGSHGEKMVDEEPDTIRGTMVKPLDLGLHVIKTLLRWLTHGGGGVITRFDLDEVARAEIREEALADSKAREARETAELELGAVAIANGTSGSFRPSGSSAAGSSGIVHTGDQDVHHDVHERDDHPNDNVPGVNFAMEAQREHDRRMADLWEQIRRDDNRRDALREDALRQDELARQEEQRGLEEQRVLEEQRAFERHIRQQEHALLEEEEWPAREDFFKRDVVKISILNSMQQILHRRKVDKAFFREKLSKQEFPTPHQAVEEFHNCHHEGNQIADQEAVDDESHHVDDHHIVDEDAPLRPHDHYGDSPYVLGGVPMKSDEDNENYIEAADYCYSDHTDDSIGLMIKIQSYERKRILHYECLQELDQEVPTSVVKIIAGQLNPPNEFEHIEGQQCKDGLLKKDGGLNGSENFSEKGILPFYPEKDLMLARAVYVELKHRILNLEEYRILSREADVDEFGTWMETSMGRDVGDVGNGDHRNLSNVPGGRHIPGDVQLPGQPSLEVSVQAVAENGVTNLETANDIGDAVVHADYEGRYDLAHHTTEMPFRFFEGGANNTTQASERTDGSSAVAGLDHEPLDELMAMPMGMPMGTTGSEAATMGGRHDFLETESAIMGIRRDFLEAGGPGALRAPTTTNTLKVAMACGRVYQEIVQTTSESPSDVQETVQFSDTHFDNLREVDAQDVKKLDVDHLVVKKRGDAVVKELDAHDVVLDAFKEKLFDSEKNRQSLWSMVRKSERSLDLLHHGVATSFVSLMDPSFSGRLAREASWEASSASSRNLEDSPSIETESERSSSSRERSSSSRERSSSSREGSSSSREGSSLSRDMPKLSRSGSKLIESSKLIEDSLIHVEKSLLSVLASMVGGKQTDKILDIFQSVLGLEKTPSKVVKSTFDPKVRMHVIDLLSNVNMVGRKFNVASKLNVVGAESRTLNSGN